MGINRRFSLCFSPFQSSPGNYAQSGCCSSRACTADVSVYFEVVGWEGGGGSPPPSVSHEIVRSFPETQPLVQVQLLYSVNQFVDTVIIRYCDYLGTIHKV